MTSPSSPSDRSTNSMNVPGIDLDNFASRKLKRILVVDDEPDTVMLLKHLLIQHGFNVSGANSGRECLKKISEISPDVILLDIMMPEMDGLETLQEIRKISQTPVIIVSAVDQKSQIVRALESGVDDYITKPFNNDEVIARINAVLRRATPSVQSETLSFPDIDLDINFSTYEVVYKKRHMDMTGKMFEVLSLLARSAPKVVTYQEIAESVWGENNLAVRNRLKYLIYLIRQEFQTVDASINLIENIDRLGYKLVTEPYQV
jgi:DNA-binding response OmpR family regulator